MERGSKKRDGIIRASSRGRERRDGEKTKGANLYDVVHSWSPKITLRLWLTHIPRSAEVMALRHVAEVV